MRERRREGDGKKREIRRGFSCVHVLSTST